MVIEDVHGPGPARAGNVIVRPEAVGICGSDFHLYSGDVAALSGLNDFYPRIQGHEISAVVDDAADSETLQPGDRVAAVQQGARVLSADPVPARRDLAKHLGAEIAVWEATEQTVQDWTDGEGPSLVVETSGQAGVLPQAIDMVTAAGRVVVVGMSSGKAPVRPGAFPEKEIDVIGSSCATADDFKNAISLVSASRASLAALFSHHFPLSRATQAFQFAISRPPDAIKIVVTVN
jgi:threonine dehydrogenase-like Zn-dependent dehydrogenase